MYRWQRGGIIIITLHQECTDLYAALIANIEFKRPKRPKLASSVSKNVQKEGRLATGNAVIQPEAEAKFLSNLKDVFPSTVVFSSILQKPTPCVQSQPVVQKLPFLLTSLHKVPYNKMTPEELNAECQVIFQTKLVVSKDEASYLEQVTRLQSQHDKRCANTCSKTEQVGSPV